MLVSMKELMCLRCVGGGTVAPYAAHLHSIPWRDGSATYGRREELIYKTRNESNGTYSVHFKFPRTVGSTM